MSYRILLLGQLIPVGHQYNLFKLDHRIIYDAKRAPSIAYADRYYLANLTCGHQLSCF